MSGAFLTDDLPGILQTDEFADVATVTSGASSGSTLNGILDNGYADVLGVYANSPVFVTASTPALVQGVTLTIKGRSYRIKGVEPDDTGVTRYPLTEV